METIFPEETPLAAYLEGRPSNVWLQHCHQHVHFDPHAYCYRRGHSRRLFQLPKRTHALAVTIGAIYIFRVAIVRSSDRISIGRLQSQIKEVQAIAAAQGTTTREPLQRPYSVVGTPFVIHTHTATLHNKKSILTRWE